MSNSVGFQITIGNLPEGWNGQPQDLLDQLSELLDIRFDEDIALFKAGATQPSTLTNRAWLKDGVKWMVPDEFGNWVPAQIDSGYKKIFVRANDPFTGSNAEPIEERALWVRSNTAADAVDRISVYLNGEWRTLFEKSDDLANLQTRVEGVIDENGDLREDTVGADQLQEGAVETLRKQFLASAYPVGTIYENATSSNNPAVLLDWSESSWEKFGQGRVTVGEGAGAGLTARTGGDTFGDEQVTLSESQMPAHSHETQIRVNGSQNGSGSTSPASQYNSTGLMTGDTGGAFNGTINPQSSTTGGGLAHPNMQPSIVVYRWRRTA